MVLPCLSRFRTCMTATPLSSTTIAKFSSTPTNYIRATLDLLHINPTMWASLPILLLRQLHCQQIISSIFLQTQLLKLLAFYFRMPLHITLGAEHSITPRVHSASLAGSSPSSISATEQSMKGQ